MLLWLWAGIILTVGRAALVVYFNRSTEFDFEDFKAIGLLASPIFYMKKSIADMWALENMATSRECKINLEDISEASEVQIGGDKRLQPIKESAFLALARHRKEIRADSGW